jgi:hypothetical protein
MILLCGGDVLATNEAKLQTLLGLHGERSICLQSEIERKRALLESAAGKINSIVAATKSPLRALGMPSLLASGVNSASALNLPLPLYAIFSQLHAVSTVFSLDVKVCLRAIVHCSLAGCRTLLVLEHLQFRETTLTNDYRLQLSSELLLN